MLALVLGALLVVGGACAGDDAVITYDGPLATTTLPKRTTTTTEAGVAVQSEWTDATANLAGTSTECGDVGWLAGRPLSGEMIAGIAGAGLYRSTGAGWDLLSPGTVQNRPATILFDPLDPNRWWEAGPYRPPGVVRTDNNGQSFQALGALDMIDSVSVNFADPERQVMLAGTHERTSLWKSIDGGATWADLGPNLPANIGFTAEALVVDADTFLLGTTTDTNAGIFRSTDGGQSWTLVSTFGAVAGAGLLATDGNVYWALADGSMVSSEDQGATWIQVTAPGTIRGRNVLQLPNGDLAAAGPTAVITSTNGGEGWQTVGADYPAKSPIGLAYSDGQQAFYVWDQGCIKDGPATVQPASIWRLAVAG